MRLEFSKLSATGNDFVVIHDASGSLRPVGSRLARELCPRRFAVGADGLLLLHLEEDGALRVDYFNADGSSAGLCANGARCAAHFAASRGMVGNSPRLHTARGELRAQIEATQVACTVPVAAGPRREQVRLADGRLLPLWWVDTGVPHVVVFLAAEMGEAIDGAALPVDAAGGVAGGVPVDFDRDAPQLRHHETWAPAGVNVDFAWAVEPGVLAMRSWERGVEGETLACGTGTVAVALAALAVGWGESVLRIQNRSGEILSVDLQSGVDGQPFPLLRGPVVHVYDGVIHARGDMADGGEGARSA